MGICESLAAIFAICKFFGIGAIADWSWGRVLLPEIITLVIYAFIIVLCFVVMIVTAAKRK